MDAADGHDFGELDSAFRALPLGAGSPCVLIARTVRGKGVPSIEARADRWFCDFSAEEVDALLAELDGGARTALRSTPLVVR